MRIYVDTNIYLDLFLGRKGRYIDFDEAARVLFVRAKSCEFEIIVSGAVVMECRRVVPASGEQLRSLRSFLDSKAIPVAVTPEDLLRASSFDTHPEDALHIAIAVRMGAEAIVTRNVRDFSSAPILVRTPESL